MISKFIDELKYNLVTPIMFVNDELGKTKNGFTMNLKMSCNKI